MVPIDWHNYIRSKESTTHQTRLNPFWITTTLLPPTTPKPHTMKYQIVAILLVAVVAIAFAGPIEKTCSSENEVFEECGTACPTTCLNRHIQNRPCIMMCKQGCFCKPGFMRKGYDALGGMGECVPNARCDSIEQ